MRRPLPDHTCRIYPLQGCPLCYDHIALSMRSVPHVRVCDGTHLHCGMTEDCTKHGNIHAVMNFTPCPKVEVQCGSSLPLSAPNGESYHNEVKLGQATSSTHHTGWLEVAIDHAMQRVANCGP